MQGRKAIVLGIDAGTTSVKTVAFALDGALLATARAGVHIARGARGEAEIDMQEMWLAVADTVRTAMDAVGDAEVVAIGVTGQGDGAWLVDRDEQPIGPAALWIDGRAGERTAQWQEDGRAAAVQRTTGSALFAGALPVLLAELAETEPERMRRAAGHRNCKDWIRLRLTGRAATDPSEASRTYLWVGSHDYDPELAATLSTPWATDLLAPVLDPSDLAGTLTKAAARELGLRPGIPVAVGLVDTAAAGVGLGAVRDGDAYAILGTTGFVGVNQPSRSAVQSEIAILLETGRGEQVLECLAPMTGTPNLDWMRHTLARDADWSDIERQARSIGPGSGGVLYLPYGATSGERAPFVDGTASASWLGLSVATTVPQLFRSVYEGLACSLTECFDLLGVGDTIAICGGGSDSDLVCQILADVSGRTIARQSAPEVGARGAATLALVAAGVHPDLSSAVTALAPGTDRFAPDAEAHAAYAAVREASIHARDVLRPTWPALRELRDRTDERTSS